VCIAFRLRKDLVLQRNHIPTTHIQMAGTGYQHIWR
jgi:hypothetical protein